MMFAGKHAHFIGIGGSSMSGLAKLFLKLDIKVTGSDMTYSHKTESLEEAGITVFIGHKAENIEGADVVVYTAAIPSDNPELCEAHKRNIPCLERSELLGLWASAFRTPICISGTHGKTTTTSMISQVFLDGGCDPTIHIGGEIELINGSTRLGHSDYFITEACEYARSFLTLKPDIAVILNIDEDHLDTYGNIDNIEKAFSQFAGQTLSGGWVVGCGDDERVRRVMEKSGRRTRSYGLSPHNELTAEQISYDEYGCAAFTATLYGHPLCEVELCIPGTVSILNALAAIAVAGICEIPMSLVSVSLGRFKNPKRRFERTGTIDGVNLYTDYSHNPAEIKNAVHNAASQPHDRVIAVWQPYTISRTKDLYNGFVECFDEADEIVITDIMVAREAPDDTFTSALITDDINKRGKHAVWTPSFDDAEKYLRAFWRPGDICISMGCGNIDLLNEQISAHGDTVR